MRLSKKNPHAVALGKLGGKKRASVLTPEELRDIARKGAKLGGKARAAKLTKEQRSEIARKAAAARWGKNKKKD